jgi:hypothetical protein
MGSRRGYRVHRKAKTRFLTLPFSQVQLERFKGETCELCGEIMNGDVGG